MFLKNKFNQFFIHITFPNSYNRVSTGRKVFILSLVGG